MILESWKVPPELRQYFEPALCGECYVCRMVSVFRGVRRVLRRDGTLWLNLGDSYSTDSGGDQTTSEKQRSNRGTQIAPRGIAQGMKPKDLCMIPARVALALQADGWWLRSVIIWAKSNPMPESVTDRPTTSHEYIYLLSKAPDYFYDADAIREGRTSDHDARVFRGGAYVNGQTDNGTMGSRKEYGDKWADVSAGRNKRTVWSVATAPYSEAHFATYPPALIEPCILAGTSERGCCAECGAPWRRVVERTGYVRAGHGGANTKVLSRDLPGRELATGGTSAFVTNLKQQTETKGWQPTCKHLDAPVVPCTVLDPFHGAGTTGLVALRQGRRYVGIDLSAEYLDMSIKRIEGDAGAQQMRMDLTA